MKYLLILFILISLQGCKSTHTTTTKNHVISDTLIKHRVEIITLPTNYTYISKKPCGKDSLTIANQSLEIGNLKLTIKNIKGQLVIEAKLDSTKSVKEKEITKHSEKQVEITKKIITQYRVPKWAWYLLGLVVVYISYRVARIYIPVIRWLPY